MTFLRICDVNFDELYGVGKNSLGLRSKMETRLIRADCTRS